MVNAYMYQPGASSGPAAQQGPAVPTTTPAYSSYQPTATQGYQASEGRLGHSAGLPRFTRPRGREKGLVRP